MNLTINYKSFISVLLMFFTMGIITTVLASDDEGRGTKNIVAKIISAPVVNNGLVEGEPTEINIILNASGVGADRALDPTVFGYQIPAGGRMEVELSDEFSRNTRINSDTGLEEVVPINPNANVILTTGPQNPIIFAAGNTVARGNWSVSDNGANLITITPNGGSGDNGLENARANEIGMKVIHIRPNPRIKDGTPFINGDDEGTISVRIYDSANNLIASGYAEAEFEEEVGRQIHNTNEGLRTSGGGSPLAETVELIDFQRVAAATALTNTTKVTPFSAGYPYAPRFLMFEALDPAVRGQFTPASYIKQVGIENVTYEVNAKKPWKAKLIHVTDYGTETIGKIVMRGPEKNSRGMILPGLGLTTLDGNGSYLSVPVKVGYAAGMYTVTVKMSDGGKATTHIIVE